MRIDRCVALCDQDACGAGVGCEGDGWPIDSEDAMIGQWSGIGIGMWVGIGIGMGIGVGFGKWGGIGIGIWRWRKNYRRGLSSSSEWVVGMPE